MARNHEDALRDFQYCGLDEPDEAEVQARIAMVRGEKRQAALAGRPEGWAGHHGRGRILNPGKGSRDRTPTFVGPLDPIVERVRRETLEAPKRVYGRDDHREGKQPMSGKGGRAPLTEPSARMQELLAAGRTIEARGEAVTASAVAQETGRNVGGTNKSIVLMRDRGWWPWEVGKPGRRPRRPAPVTPTVTAPAVAIPAAAPGPDPAPDPPPVHRAQAQAQAHGNGNGNGTSRPRLPAPAAAAADCLDVATAVVRALRPLARADRLRVLEFVRAVLADFGGLPEPFLSPEARP